jgi:hypothetical protein
VNQETVGGTAPGLKTGPESFYLIPNDVMDDLSQDVWTEVIKLPVVSQMRFVEEFRRKRKSSGVAVVLCLVLGLHYGYLGNWTKQLIYWVTGGGVMVWMFADLFRMSRLVHDANTEIARTVFALIKTTTEPIQRASGKPG